MDEWFFCSNTKPKQSSHSHAHKCLLHCSNEVWGRNANEIWKLLNQYPAPLCQTHRKPNQKNFIHEIRLWRCSHSSFVSVSIFHSKFYRTMPKTGAAAAASDDNNVPISYNGYTRLLETNEILLFSAGALHCGNRFLVRWRMRIENRSRFMRHKNGVLCVTQKASRRIRMAS